MELNITKARHWAFVILALLCFLSPITVAAADKQAAVASAHPLATEAGLDVLRAGGNAFDAAVAVSAALAVVEPYSSGLGGGGFWLLHIAKTGRNVVIDGRERAPLASTPTMYTDAAGVLIPRASLDGARAAAIPGAPAALDLIAHRYGKLPLTRSLAPAIRFANDGFAVEARYHKMVAGRLDALRASPAAAAVFLRDNEAPSEGVLLRQTDLAVTLRSMALNGAAAIYRGVYAEHWAAGVRAAGGIWSVDDLASYTAIERAPVTGRYRGWRIVSVPLPSSGGIVLIEMLNILRELPWEHAEPLDRVHYTAEAMRLAYRDRAAYLGDVESDAAPLKMLLSREYARTLARRIDPFHATPSQDLLKANPQKTSADNTSHFSIMDADGNWVSATLSINYPFGSGFMVPGTGIVLNDEMDDFAPPNGQANGYGLVGSSANEIGPGKRPLSNMTPTFVIGDGGVALLGTPGGSRIISMVLLGVQSLLRGESVQRWVATPRYHHQYLPDELQFEPDTFDADEQQTLQQRGYALKSVDRKYGNMQAIWWDRRRNAYQAASDPRGIGSAAVIRIK